MRFTVFSNDANVTLSNVSGNERPRKFEWNLKVGSVVKYIKIAIESIFCRNTRAVLQNKIQGQVKAYNILARGNKNSNTYQTLYLYNTSTQGDGVGLKIQNRRHRNAGGDITSLLVTKRGSGYEMGDLVTVLDKDGIVPSVENAVTMEIMDINDDEFDHDLTAIDVTSDDQMMRIVQMGNTDERESFSIRCPSIGNQYDDRDETFKNVGNLIYMGPFKLQNTNPRDAYSYDIKDSDFLNGSFELSVDSNFLAENGISSDIVSGVTFLFMFPSYKHG